MRIHSHFCYNETVIIKIDYPSEWAEYELLDSGDGEKLERFGTYIIARPDPRALWQKTNSDMWDRAHATFTRTDPKTGTWHIRATPPDPWILHYKSLAFTLRPTEFKHVGIFPEQAANWNWLDSIIHERPLNILNLFAYTGGATMACLAAGAKVTHVDAAKSTIAWAKENLVISAFSEKPIRWIEDDAYKFVMREQKRGNMYDGIILDPPRFGRGSKGEVWKLEDHLPQLLVACKRILSQTPTFVLINAYTADLSPIVLERLMGDMTHEFGGSIESGELTLKESASGKLLPNGIFSRWSKNGTVNE